MTGDASYPWSSYVVHGLGKADDLIDAAPVWQGLRKTEENRQAYWRQWLHLPITARELERIRRSVASGRSYGDETWVE